MTAAIHPLWPDNDPLFDPTPPSCEAPTHLDGPCPVTGLDVIVEELEMLAVAASVRRDARLGLGDHAWQVIAEDEGVRVVIPA